MGNYLDKTGLTYFWGKLKDYFQPKLVSGTNIKTINNESVLGSGNIVVQGGGGQLYTAVSESTGSTISSTGISFTAIVDAASASDLTPENLSQLKVFHRTAGKGAGEYYYYPHIITRISLDGRHIYISGRCIYDGYDSGASTYLGTGKLFAVAPFEMTDCGYYFM